ncbi:hypothetical protein [Oceanobacter kriegii]|uniref:hypothetical protein n=1 Tax=Oceanobacter kriegii TaxID=64972 RepID=UPI0004005E24|nr:hypothetical protein [Oceanobacter kriegii]
MNRSTLSLILTSGLVFSASAHAEYENRSFSVFGAAGMQHINYQESLKDWYGVDMDSKFTTVNFVQRSGGYTAVNDRIGFSIISTSTLIGFENDEEWKLAGSDGYVQQSTTQLDFASLDINLSYHFQNGWYATGGMHYQKTSFSRFRWTMGTANDALNSTMRSYIESQPDMMAVVDAKVADDTGRNADINSRDDYFNDIANDPEANATVVYEDASNFGVMAGIAYDSYFMRQTSGPRYQFSLEAGTPIYERVLNSGVNETLDRTFGGGLDVTGKIGAGYQFGTHLSTMLLLTAHYSHRDEIVKRYNALDTTTLPENTLQAYAAYLSIGWNFD